MNKQNAIPKTELTQDKSGTQRDKGNGTQQMVLIEMVASD